MITLVNYRVGNIRAFVNVYHQLNIPVAIASEPKELKAATKIILPGVGAFDDVMQKLDKSGMRPALEELIRQRKTPVLGICVGMQILAHSSEEGRLPGLGWIDGVVKKFDQPASARATPLPHMGWNEVRPVRDHRVLAGLGDDSRFYFLHSYFFQCRNGDDILAQTFYGEHFASAVHSDNIFGVQFHPEKSHRPGIALLKNFAEL